MRLLGLAAFALVGYLALYAWLRASGEIEFFGLKNPEGAILLHYARPRWVASPDLPPGILSLRYSAIIRIHGRLYVRYVKPSDSYDVVDGEWPRKPLMMAAMWPAVRLEAALARRGWLSWHVFETAKERDRPTVEELDRMVKEIGERLSETTTQPLSPEVGDTPELGFPSPLTAPAGAGFSRE